MSAEDSFFAGHRLGSDTLTRDFLGSSNRVDSALLAADWLGEIVQFLGTADAAVSLNEVTYCGKAY
jgi:hypothetical protein